VEGAIRARGDCLRSAHSIAQNPLRRDTNNPETVVLDELKAVLIPMWPVRHIVNDPFHFDHQPLVKAAEIDDVGPDRVLAPEFEPPRALAQFLP
jgi:hypothetical protein